MTHKLKIGSLVSHNGSHESCGMIIGVKTTGYQALYKIHWFNCVHLSGKSCKHFAEYIKPLAAKKS